MKKKLAALLSFFALFCGATLSAVALTTPASAEEELASSDKRIEYDYALLGEVYEIPDGILSATHPNGSALPTDQDVLLNWAQGSYRFEFSSKIVDVRVYEYAPEDNTTLLGEMPEGVTVGIESTFPALEAQSTISRTDAAPDIEPYTVNAVFWHNGNRVYTERNVTEDFVFTPNLSGLWMLSYEYMNVFGQTVSKEYAFTVKDERIILVPWAEEIPVGSQIALGDAYGFYQNEKYAVTTTVTTPSGSTEKVTGNYQFTESGKHSFLLESEIAGQRTQKTVEITAQTGAISFVSDTVGLSSGKLHKTPTSIVGENVDTHGILYDMIADKASLSYNGVIDLTTMDNNTPLIVFTTNNSYAGTIKQVTVTLTDVYDATNTINVTFFRNSDMTETSMSYDNVFIYGSFAGTSQCAISNYQEGKGLSNVSWQGTFDTYCGSDLNTHPDRRHALQTNRTAMNFAFDETTNTAYSYGMNHLAGFTGEIPKDYPTDGAMQWYPVIRFSDPALVTKPFKGFTTGEVYLTLNVDAGRGDILIQSIGGKTTFDERDIYTENTAVLLGEFDSNVNAARGYAYSVPTYPNKYVSNLDCRVTYGGVEIPVENGAFVPNELGEYVVTYSGVNAFGRRVEKAFTVTCTEKEDIDVSYPTAEILSMNSVYTIKEPTLSGGYGKLDYTLTINGKPISVGDKVLVEKDMKITVEVKDSVETVIREFLLTVDKDVREITVDFPKTVARGSVFTFPQAVVYDYLTESTLPYEIYVDGVRQTAETMTIPDELTTLNVEYRTEKGSWSYPLYVKNATVKDANDVVLLGEGASLVTTKEGTTVNVKADDATVSVRQMLSANALNFEFSILEEELNFNRMSIRMTDKNGVSVRISIVGLLGKYPTLYVNGQDTLIAVEKRVQTFPATASEGYVGKSYYAFSLTYENWHKAMLNGGKILTDILTDERGLQFNGFESGVYVDFIPEEMNAAETSFIISKVSNQLFYELAFRMGDIVGPQISSLDFELSSTPVSEGFQLDVRRLIAYDVFQSSSTVTVSLKMPNGSFKYENITPSEAEVITLNEVGIYLLIVTMKDAAGAINQEEYRFTIEDTKAPVITLSGDLAKVVKKGETVALAAAAITDNSAVTSKIIVFNADGSFVTLATGDNTVSGSWTAEAVGTYAIYYFAEDAVGNVASKIGCIITVEE